MPIYINGGNVKGKWIKTLSNSIKKFLIPDFYKIIQQFIDYIDFEIN